MANARGAAVAAAGDEAHEALTVEESTVGSFTSGVRRGPCNTWDNAAPAGHVTSGRRTRRRRGSTDGSDDEGPAARRTRLCSTIGCGRRYVKCRHAHCCSLCSMGHHTDRCDAKWTKFRAATLRLRVSSCLILNCQRAAGAGHIHCCGMCAPSDGAQHTEACTERQNLVRTGRRASTNESANNSGAPVETLAARMITIPPQHAPMEVVSSSEDDDTLVAAAEGSQKNSSRGIDEISGATADAYGPSESTASSFTAAMDLNALD